MHNPSTEDADSPSQARPPLHDASADEAGSSPEDKLAPDDALTDESGSPSQARPPLPAASADEAGSPPEDKLTPDDALTDESGSPSQARPPLPAASADEAGSSPEDKLTPDAASADEAGSSPEDKLTPDDALTDEAGSPSQARPPLPAASADEAGSLPEDKLAPDDASTDEAGSPPEDRLAPDDGSTDDAGSPTQDTPVSYERSSDTERGGRDEVEQDEAKRPRAPRNIGPRRSRTSNRLLHPSDEVATNTFIPKPELMCRQPLGSQYWELVLSAPQDCDIKSVHHNGTELPAQNSEYHLSSFSGILVVKYADDSKDKIPFSDGAPLIFKLPKDWQGDGRKTTAITQGHFIVFAPSGSTRVGVAPVEKEKCVDGNYVAHYFFNGQNNETSTVGGFKEFNIPLTQAGYVLDGQLVHDDSEDGGLFVGAVPILTPAPGTSWVRVGEEREIGWKGVNFNPADISLKDVLGDRRGSFYIRVYDESVRLVDSGEFRYSSQLQAIRVNGEPYSWDMLLAPSSRGHLPTTLQFIADDGAAIEAKLKTDTPYVTVASDGNAMIAPHPNGDETMWIVDSTDVVIKLPRLWWRMDVPSEGPVSWCDRAICMSRDEFRSWTHAKLEVRVPASIKGVQVGFRQQDQYFPAERVEGNLRCVTLPLAAFVDYEEVDEFFAEDVSLKVRCGDFELALIRIISEQPQVESHPFLDLANAEPESMETPERPHAYVKRPNGRMRYGRGFSRGELLGADLSLASAALLSIPLDRRRRRTHSSNIETLTEVKRHA